MFWIFMMFFELLIPLTMIGFGTYFMQKAPKEINSVFGYRSTMSMLNKKTWAFAHDYCGKLWLKIGSIMLPISVISMFFVLGKDEHTIGIIGSILCGLQVIFLIGSIIPTEIALRNNFDRFGRKKSI